MKRIGYTAQDHDKALEALSGWVGRTITSSNELTTADAGAALDAIRAEEARRATQAGPPPPDSPPEDDHDR